MDSLKLLEELVAIRSDRSASPPGGSFEYGVATYLATFIKKHFPSFQVEEHVISEGRANLFVHDGSPIELLFAGHMDTVEEGTGWTMPAYGARQGNRFYGRGSGDGKAGLVAILGALEEANRTNTKGIGALFYADEEYSSMGMRHFVQTYKSPHKPQLIVCIEPTQEKLRRGTRGIVELSFTVKGKSGHSARPATGINAFEGFVRATDALRDYLQTVEHPDLGRPTLNVATVHAGTLQNGDRTLHGPVLGVRGNVIPDHCEGTIEVRTVPGLHYEDIVRALKRGVAKHRSTIKHITTSINLGSFVTSKEHLTSLENVQANVMGDAQYQNMQQSGYSDVQMLAEAWDVPTVIWGPKTKNTHGADEYVEIASLEKMEKALKLIVKKWPSQQQQEGERRAE